MVGSSRDSVSNFGLIAEQRVSVGDKVNFKGTGLCKSAIVAVTKIFQVRHFQVDGENSLSERHLTSAERCRP